MTERTNAQQRISQAVIEILHQDPLMGEILINISREIINQGDEVISLGWQHDHLILRAVAEKVNQLRRDELVQLLKHEALHVAWQHPVRYADYSDRDLVSLACDIAVNQYLEEPPAGTMTLARISQILHQPLASRQDSSYYLRVLRQLTPQQRRQLQAESRNRHYKDPQGSHQGWFTKGNQLVREGRVKHLIQQSQEQLTTHQRGLIPQELQKELNPSDHQYRLPIAKAFWQLIEQFPNGHQPTRARFNRRQPQRLDLPGQITRFVARIMVFIDESGSMSDETISRAITMLNQLAKQVGFELMVGDFDAKIQTVPQLVSQGHSLSLERHGGGGTRYQAVFDYLAEQKVSKQMPIIIVTDGWGEDEIENYGYQRVLWLLTSDSSLSVTNIPTMVSRLEEK